MKKFAKIAVTASIFTFALGASAGAQVNIDNTGRDSDQRVRVEENNRCKSETNSNVKVDNNTKQNAQSGNAKSTDNRGNGNTGSGNAGNTSSTNTNVGVDQRGDNCVQAQANQKPIPTPGGRGAGVTPTAGGQAGAANQGGAGAGAAQGGRGGAVAGVTTLPETSAATPVGYAAAAAGLLGALALGSRLVASAAFRR